MLNNTKDIIEQAKHDDGFFRGWVVAEIITFKEQLQLCVNRINFVEAWTYKILGGMGLLNVLFVVFTIYERIHK